MRSRLWVRVDPAAPRNPSSTFVVPLNVLPRSPRYGQGKDARGTCPRHVGSLLNAAMWLAPLSRLEGTFEQNINLWPDSFSLPPVWEYFRRILHLAGLGWDTDGISPPGERFLGKLTLGNARRLETPRDQLRLLEKHSQMLQASCRVECTLDLMSRCLFARKRERSGRHRRRQETNTNTSRAFAFSSPQRLKSFC